MIFTYNKEHVGDVLMIIVKKQRRCQVGCGAQRQGSPCFLKENGETVAWIFRVQLLKLQSAVKSF